MELNIPESVQKKVMHWVNKSNNEVSGFGKVIYDAETKTFTVVDAYLMKQENGSAHTDIDPAALGKLMYVSREVEGELKWWWHSHVNMAVFWSGTDTETIKDLGKNGWIVASVFNKREEIRSALCYKAQSSFGEVIHLEDDIKTMILTETDEDELKSWDKEYNDNVTEKKFQPSYTGSMYGMDYDRDLDDRWEKDSMGHWKWVGDRKSAGDGTTALTSPGTTTAKATINPLEMVRAAKLSPAEKEDMAAMDKEYYREHGYWGHGLYDEARALKMKPEQYLNILVYGTSADLGRIEDKLEELVERGVLV